MLHNKFDKIFCINLDRRSDRWENVQQEFQKHGIENVERFSAIDGNIHNITTNLLSGEIGCLLSHIEIVKKAKELGLKNYLVFEDDVEFKNNFNELFDKFNTQLPEDWDMVYLGGSNIDKPNEISDNVIKLNNTYTSHSIVIKNTLYDIILDMLPKMEKQVDVYFAELQKKYNCYCVTPTLVWQVSGYSDIQMKETNYTFLK
jgi:GR25 family glycosyltransferase involved in LPS biosynthesis